MKREIKPTRKVIGTVSVPGDKSIAHRAALLSILAKGPFVVRHFPDGKDCGNSLAAAEQCGVTVSKHDGLLELTPPAAITLGQNATINCGNSGTTARLLSGIIAGSNLSAMLVGDESLSRRPMKRIVDPLTRMGAEVTAHNGGLPLSIRGHSLLPFEYRLPIPSAQVKSALLLAGLASGCSVRILEDIVTRDHTELMIATVGSGITVRDIKPVPTPDPNDPRRTRMIMPDTFKRETILESRATLRGGEIDIPGDISTAAFLFGAAAICRGSVTVTNCGLNPTRTAILDHLKAIGCKITIDGRQVVSGELRGIVTVEGGPLKSRKIGAERTVELIDEIPVVAVLAAFAEGTTVIRGASELRVKESDRLSALADNLGRMGVKCGLLEDGIAVEGCKELQGADLSSFGDHRIAMAMTVAALAASGPSTIDDTDIVSISCPTFYELMGEITH
jgi:3-phosphoshikimate 1-carboxyvinyltransferase